jgi:hypothetical protein
MDADGVGRRALMRQPVRPARVRLSSSKRAIRAADGSWFDRKRCARAHRSDRSADQDHRVLLWPVVRPGLPNSQLRLCCQRRLNCVFLTREHDRGGTIGTRNCRLAAIRRHLGRAARLKTLCVMLTSPLAGEACQLRGNLGGAASVGEHVGDRRRAGPPQGRSSVACAQNWQVRVRRRSPALASHRRRSAATREWFAAEAHRGL